VPTLDEYLPRVVAAAGPGTRKAYGSYWNHMTVAWGIRRLDRITATDIEELAGRVAAGVRPRRTGRGGRSAREHLIAATRAVYTPAITDDLLPVGSSPAHRVAKPRRFGSQTRYLQRRINTLSEIQQSLTTAQRR
jgi:hypothetical protein